MISSMERLSLDNGIEVYLQPMDGLRSVSIGLAVKVGSAFEKADQSGIAHFSEHLVFKGTQKRNAFDLKEPIERVGGTLNAFTGKENTVYFCRVPDSYSNVAIDILLDLVTDAAFPEDQFRLEQEVILEEINASQDDPVDTVYENFFRTVWNGSPYSRPVLGTAESIMNMKLEDIKSFYRNNYTTSRMVFSVAGNFGDDIIPRLASLRASADEPSPKTVRFDPDKLITREIREDIQQIHLILGIEAPSRKNPDYYAFQVLNTLLTSGMSSRLFHRIREELGLVYAIESDLIAYPSGGVYFLYAATACDKYKRLIEELQNQFNHLISDGIRAEELAYGKERLMGKLLLSTESTYTSMMRNLDNGIAHSRSVAIEEIEEKIQKVTLETINRIIKENFQKGWITSLVVPKIALEKKGVKQALEKEFVI